MANGDGNGNNQETKSSIEQVSAAYSGQIKLLQELEALEKAAQDAKAAGFPINKKAQEDINTLTSLTKDYRQALDEQAASEEAAAKAAELRKEAMKAGEEVMGAFLGQQNLAALSLSGLTSELFKQVGAFDEASTALGINSGFTKALNKDMRDAASGANGLSVSMSQAGAALGNLSTNMSLFATLNADSRAEITNTVLALEKLGVSSEVSAAALDTMTRGMGMSAGASEDMLKSFDRLAQEVGLPVSEVAEGFASIGKELARYGKDGPKIFKKLAKEARSLGMSVQDAFNIAEAFDTFEEAADLAGKLNAQIGLQLNSVDLMNASHEDRIKILRDEFKMRGKNFDDMSRRQRQAIAEVMGVDVDMASRLFGDPVELRKYQKEQQRLEERAKAVTTVTEDLKNIFEDLMLMLGPTVEKIRDFIKLVSGSGTAKVIIAGLAITKFAGGFSKLSGAIGGLMGKGAESMTSLSDGIKSAGTAAKTSVASTLAMAAAIAAIGAGVFMAATGVGNLVKSFKEVGDNAPAAVAGILAFGVAVGIIIVALAKLAPAAIPAIAVLGGIALAAMGVGKAMEFISNGLNLILNAAAGLASAILGPISAIASSMAAMFATLGSIGVLGMLGLAAGVSDLADGISELMSAAQLDKIMAVDSLLESLNSAGASLETIKATTDSLNALESVMTISAEIDEAKIKAISAVASGGAEGGAVAPAPKPASYTIPITFQIKNDKVAQYVVDVVNNEFDLTRVK